MKTQNITLKCMLSRYLRKTYDLQVINQNVNVIFAVQLDLFQMVFVSQHFNIKIYSLVFLFLAPGVCISAATKTIGVVCFRKVTPCTVVKCSLSTQQCLSKVNLYTFMQRTSSACMLHGGDYLATAGILLMTCIETFLGVGEYEGCLCASETLYVSL